MQKKKNSSKATTKQTAMKKDNKAPRKLTNKEKAIFSEQNRVDMFPVDTYND